MNSSTMPINNDISNAAIARQGSGGVKNARLSRLEVGADVTVYQEEDVATLLAVLLGVKQSLDRFVEVQEMQSICLSRMEKLLGDDDARGDRCEIGGEVHNWCSKKPRKPRKKRNISPGSTNNCGGAGMITKILIALIYVILVVYQPFGMGDESSGEFAKIDLENITLTNIGAAIGTEVESENSSSLVISHRSGDIWNTSDGFSFVHSSRGEGDFVLSIFIDGLDSLGLIRAGLMIRETLDPGSKQIFLNTGSSKKTGFLMRDETDKPNKESIKSYNFDRGELLLRKYGSTLSGFARAASQKEWTFIQTKEIIGFESFYVGVAVSTQPLLGRCGGGDYGDGVCRDGKCCSKFGYCGSSDNHCKAAQKPLPLNDTSTLEFSNLVSDISLIESLGIPRSVLYVSWFGSRTSSTINKYDVTLSNIGGALGVHTEAEQGLWSLVSSSKDIGVRTICFSQVTVEPKPNMFLSCAPYQSNPTLISSFVALPPLQGINDDFTYLHSSNAEGDFMISFFVEKFESLLDRRTKAGLMIRETLTPGSRHAYLYVDGYGKIGFLVRDSTGQQTKEHEGNSIFASNDSLYHEDFQRGELRLRKNGSSLTGYVRAATQNEWTDILSLDIDFERFYVGVAVSTQPSNIATLEFSNFDAFVWFSTPTTNTKNALTSFYEATGGDAWTNNDGWLESENYCDWFGITCNDKGNVTYINLRDNSLSGHLSPSNTSRYYGLGFYLLHNLGFIDFSHNNLNGEADVMLSPTSAWYVDFSHNNFSSISKIDNSQPSSQTLQYLYLNHNSIEQNVNEIMNDDIPSNLIELRLSDNKIKGNLPTQFPLLQYLEEFVVHNNELSGQIPRFIHLSLPLLKVLNLANQSQLTGSIPAGLSRIPQLKYLNLSKNGLSNTIPSVLGDLNFDELDLSSNDLEGLIPSELADIQNSLISLNGNTRLWVPSPLSLCLNKGYDLVNNTNACPPERISLREIYLLAKGSEWTENAGWDEEHTHHCSWHGVECDDTNTSVTELVLKSNGVSGKLSDRIADLHSLRKLDLSDNDIKGHIPSQLGLLSGLTYLRLSYNAFVGEIPLQLENLHNLNLLHLHGNRIKGIVPNLDKQAMTEESSFITDCGVPTDFDEPLECEECTVCCNSDGDCHFNQKTAIEDAGFTSYKNFSWVFFLAMLLFLGLVATMSYLRERRRHLPIERQIESSRRLWVINRGKMLTTIGTDSVYCFVLSKSWSAWTILSIVVGLQLWMLFEFVSAAQLDFSDDKSEFVYSWKCPRNSETCWDESDITWTGWFIFALMMLSHLMADFLNGLKLLVMCGKQRLSHYRRMRLFFGGVCLCLVSSFTAFASTVYNRAIARSNPDIIVNSIIILFITDIDEKFYKLIRVINPRWVNELTGHNAQMNGNGSDIEAGSKSDGGASEDELERLRQDVENLRQLVLKQTAGEKKIQPQVLDAADSPHKWWRKQPMESDSEISTKEAAIAPDDSKD